MFSLCALDDGGFMSGGGRDRLIVLWSETYQPLKEIEVTKITKYLTYKPCIVLFVSLERGPFLIQLNMFFGIFLNAPSLY